MRVIALPLLLFLATPAIGAEPQPSRYVFVPVEAGTLRLDTMTGKVSLCTVASGAAACTAIPDDVRDTTNRVAELQDRVMALEARVAALENRSLTGQLSTDEESLDRVMVLADRMVRQFFGTVRDIKREMEGREP